jgi:hypothetical protein
MPKVEIVQYGPFEIEVGSPAYVRLTEQEAIPFAEVAEIDVDAAEQSEGAGRGLSSLTRDALNEHAAAAGVESPEALNAKADVVAAIEAAKAPAGETLGA